MQGNTNTQNLTTRQAANGFRGQNDRRRRRRVVVYNTLFRLRRLRGVKNFKPGTKRAPRRVSCFVERVSQLGPGDCLRRAAELALRVLADAVRGVGFTNETARRRLAVSVLDVFFFSPATRSAQTATPRRGVCHLLRLTVYMRFA